MNSAKSSTPPVSGPWWRELSGYHWFVFLIAAFGWMFDCFDQQIFTMSRSITMRDLMPETEPLAQLRYGNWATSIFIIGWATGGLIFGSVGDKWGRAKSMALTILVYAICTGLSGFARNWEVFALFRFLTGAGVGGEFAVGAALLAEVMPDRARPHALGALQALSAVGNVLAAVSLGLVVPGDKLGWGWRGLYYLGALPALIAVFVFWRLKEPERWVAAKAAATKAQTTRSLGRLSDLFTNPHWRRNTLVGLGLAVAGQIGLWGVGFYTPELIDSAIPAVELQTRPKIETILDATSSEAHSTAVAALDEKQRRKYADLVSRISPARDQRDVAAVLANPLNAELKEKMRLMLAKSIPEDRKTNLKMWGGILQQIGAFLGISCFTILAARRGRRLSFLVALVLAWGSLVLTFATFHEPRQIWYLWPILGFCTLAPFGGYAIYFPELFPTRLRTTGTSFCYNVGRYITAFGVSILGPLAAALHGLTPIPGFRIAAMALACSYLVGLIALIWAPETVNRTLPEDEKGFAR
ncbi:MAG: MFS transporter [Verrucomicrobia bacterium]|nr:MAG: MFS transporter [Verrucomicrobiota bacterium]